jgi:hypothetical protein
MLPRRGRSYEGFLLPSLAACYFPCSVLPGQPVRQRPAVMLVSPDGTLFDFPRDSV